MVRPSFARFAQQYLAALLQDFGTVYLNTLVPRNPDLRVFELPSRNGWDTDYLRSATANQPTDQPTEWPQAMISPKVIGEARLVDVLFEPHPTPVGEVSLTAASEMQRGRSLSSLGLLGNLLIAPAIIVPWRWAPNQWDFRKALSCLLQWQVEADIGMMLIVAPSVFPQFLDNMGASPAAVKGVYQMPSAYCTTIVVTSELPQDASTLWLRLLGRGPTQRAALQHLMQLEDDHPWRDRILAQFRHWSQHLAAGHQGKESRALTQMLATLDSPN